jgi:hypothetical protein
MVNSTFTVKFPGEEGLAAPVFEAHGTIVMSAFVFGCATRPVT